MEQLILEFKKKYEDSFNKNMVTDSYDKIMNECDKVIECCNKILGDDIDG